MNNLNNKKDIYTLKSFSILGITSIFLLFWIPILMICRSCGQTSLFIDLFSSTLLIDFSFLFCVIFLLLGIKFFTKYSGCSPQEVYFDWNIISMIFVVCEEFFLIKSGLFDSSLFKDSEGIIASILIIVLIVVQGFIALQLGMSVCTRFKNQLFLYNRHAFKTIDTLLSNLSMGTFLVSIIFSLYGDIDMGDEVKAIVATIISINVCMFINKICFSLFYSPENRHAIDVCGDYHFFSLFENDDSLS